MEKWTLNLNQRESLRSSENSLNLTINPSPLKKSVVLYRLIFSEFSLNLRDPHWFKFRVNRLTKCSHKISTADNRHFINKSIIIVECSLPSPKRILMNPRVQNLKAGLINKVVRRSPVSFRLSFLSFWLFSISARSCCDEPLGIGAQGPGPRT